MQERIGRDEKQFKIVKFRTMKTDAEKETGPVWAKKQDDRRTRMGTFLRRWNLDELPQFINVLKGEMSLVGPRPERPHFVVRRIFDPHASGRIPTPPEILYRCFRAPIHISRIPV
jgi:lipopolysaccharide/colanic/teichoic acid biosynthesis glycosyltransferase